MKRFNTYVLICLSLLFIAAGDGNGTPDPGKWRQQSLIGANETHFFYFETTRIFPGSYCDFSEQVTICRKRKSDFIVDETILLRSLRYRADPDTMLWTRTTDDTTASFDLSKYLRENRICPAIHGKSRNLPLYDKDGIYRMDGRKKVILLPMISIYGQAPLLDENPRVVGSWVTAEPWSKTPDYKKLRQTVYYLIQSGEYSEDMESAEDIVVVRGD